MNSAENDSDPIRGLRAANSARLLGTLSTVCGARGGFAAPGPMHYAVFRGCGQETVTAAALSRMAAALLPSFTYTRTVYVPGADGV